MTTATIKATLETALNNITPALATAWENASYTPIEGTPYQRVWFLFAQPDNWHVGQRFRQNGYMQVSLFYPLGNGAKDALTRAELIRSTFKAGMILSGVSISATPEISSGETDGDRYVLNVFIRFSEFVTV